MDYKQKYLKYKQKYLELKKLLGGRGRRPTHDCGCGQQKWTRVENTYDLPNRIDNIFLRCRGCSRMMPIYFVHEGEEYRAPASICPRQCWGKYRFYCSNRRCRANKENQDEYQSDSDGTYY
jgi:hypothetical protein